ncbi:Competence protein F [Halomicronema hongdechloris C2206]|uniref:Competence protein F n=1 Tax=Halomicronema hongdechloris C2206 TaxID=1641165 RepID=A0A1Z3HSL8_9CYAN|nr:ComF family protein [Halomicronema hongdechloris]ASC73304.1 Competence protein F [Halomicronema hongdechloris C2206]
MQLLDTLQPSIAVPWWKRTASSLLQLVLEAPCPLCERSTTVAVCSACQRQLRRCQLSAAVSQQIGLRVFGWGSYQGPLRRALAALKYDHQPQIADLLGTWLGQSWQDIGRVNTNRLIVVPIPLHAIKQQQRGYNQAALLAERFCQQVRLPLSRDGLVRQRATEAQFGLSAEERQANVQQAFGLGPQWLKRRPSQSVLLIDDIFTTGATARAAANVLRRHGISVWGIAAVALAQRQSTCPDNSTYNLD